MSEPAASLPRPRSRLTVMQPSLRKRCCCVQSDVRKLIVFAFACAALEAAASVWTEKSMTRNGPSNDAFHGQWRNPAGLAGWRRLVFRRADSGGRLRPLLCSRTADSIQVIHVSACTRASSVPAQRSGVVDQRQVRLADARSYLLGDAARRAGEILSPRHGCGSGPITAMGRGRFELKLRTHAPESRSRRRAVFVSGPKKQCYWPETLDDDTRNPKAHRRRARLPHLGSTRRSGSSLSSPHNPVLESTRCPNRNSVMRAGPRWFYPTKRRTMC
jgi:hypothetical protein